MTMDTRARKPTHMDIDDGYLSKKASSSSARVCVAAAPGHWVPHAVANRHMAATSPDLSAESGSCQTDARDSKTTQPLSMVIYVPYISHGHA